MTDSLIAYCGRAALPDDLRTRWNIDLLLLAALAALAFAVGRGRAADARAGWGAIALMRVVFVSPLCALSSALFFSPTGRFGRTSFATPSVAAWQKCTRSAATRARW